MSDSHILSMAAIAEFFIENNKVLEKGETAARKNNRVSSFQYDDAIKVITGQVDPSMKKNKYKVSIFLTSQYKIERATCECPNGLHRCSHMAALAVTAYDNISCTDTTCAWKRSMPPKSQDAIRLENLYGRPSIVSIDREASSSEIQQFAVNLWPDVVGYTWLLKQDPGPIAYRSQIVDIIVNVESVLKSDEYQTLSESERQRCLQAKLKLSDQNIEVIANQTIEQANSIDWHTARKNRLTASNFGKILAAIRRDSFPKSFWSNLLGK